jgi:hypothetical protein
MRRSGYPQSAPGRVALFAAGPGISHIDVRFETVVRVKCDSAPGVVARTRATITA